MTKRTVEIEFSAAFHHGSGYGLSGVVDRAILRDANGVPFLAGSAVKGKLRHAALRVLLAEGKPACQYADDKAACREPDFCALCRLFGSAAKQGDLRFGDARPVQTAGKLLERISELPTAGVYHRDASIRFGIGMSRAAGRVRPRLLFSSETLPESLVFEAPLYGDATGDDLELLENACRVLTHFGAGGARGMGRCEYRLRRTAREEAKV